jgi:DNA-binding NtrC family response regulator
MHISDLAADPSLVWGPGATMNSIKAAALEIAPTDIPILILGESGTGKEVFARLLHRLSLSSEGDFKKLSCSILEPAELLHRFRHDFHTSSQARPLRTLFLDSIDELDPACQRTLLTMLPDGQERSENAAKSVRVISSSCRDVEEVVQLGHFRKELFFRINGFCLRLPSLSAFVEFFRGKYSQELRRPAPELGQDTLDILRAYDWPGNIRELENLVRKMVVFGNAQAALDDIRASRPVPASSRGFVAGASLKAAAKAACRSAERELILQALERTRWNRKRAARDLQISYKSLLYKIKQIGVAPGKNES